jgi:hypothetical protein
MALLYGGPDQIMVVASGLATVVGAVMMVWNKICVFFGKIVDKFKPAAAAQEPAASTAPKDGK